jgi:hypothetical protein
MYLLWLKGSAMAQYCYLNGPSRTVRARLAFSRPSSGCRSSACRDGSIRPSSHSLRSAEALEGVEVDLLDQVAEQQPVPDASLSVGVALDPPPDPFAQPFLVAGEGRAEGAIVAPTDGVGQRPGGRVLRRHHPTVERDPPLGQFHRPPIRSRPVRLNLPHQFARTALQCRVQVGVRLPGEQGPTGELELELDVVHLAVRVVDDFDPEVRSREVSYRLADGCEQGLHPLPFIDRKVAPIGLDLDAEVVAIVGVFHGRSLLLCVSGKG